MFLSSSQAFAKLVSGKLMCKTAIEVNGSLAPGKISSIRGISLKIYISVQKKRLLETNYPFHVSKNDRMARA